MSLKPEDFKEIIQWAISSPFEPNLTTVTKYSKAEKDDAIKKEKEWGNLMTGGKNNTQWMHPLGLSLLKFIFDQCDKEVLKPKEINGYKLDWETDDAVWLIRVRNWTSNSGIGSDKIAGYPFLYSDVPRLYKKNLNIVCVGYQEWDLKHGPIRIFSDDIKPEQNLLNDVYLKLGIQIIPFSCFINLSKLNESIDGNVTNNVDVANEDNNVDVANEDNTDNNDNNDDVANEDNNNDVVNNDNIDGVGEKGGLGEEYNNKSIDVIADSSYSPEQLLKIKKKALPLSKSKSKKGLPKEKKL